MAARRGGGRRGARRRGGRAVRVGAEWRPDPPPPCVLPTVAHHSRTLRHPCKIHARSIRRCRAHHRSVMEVEPPRLQPAFAYRFRAHNRVEPDPPMSHPSPLDSRADAVPDPAHHSSSSPNHHHRSFSTPVLLVPEPPPPPLLLDAKTSPELPHRHSSSPNRRRRSSSLHEEPQTVADP
uniref:Uncharacterized protein n=1 Tax=Oryza sativa subsp. japonica TaxID=39947 RepID=Q69TQ6_ORYSJ|nr:hypothetical protein [Oryza sativa Japonica Group]BAD35771.1 hypothetical protein [Oryza sativa Japonica Group]